MKQQFSVLNISGESVDGVCVQFMYKGVLISASKILFGPVMAFDKNDIIVASGITIESVIDEINRLNLG